MKPAKVNIPQESLPGNDERAPARFSKAYHNLMELGLHPRLIMLYGRLEHHAGKNGRCNPRHSVLAKEIGIRHRYHIQRMLMRLRDLRLIDWNRRGPHANFYRVLEPDLRFVKDVLSSAHVKDVRSGAHLDVRSSAHRKESSSKEQLSGSRVFSSPTSAPETEKPNFFEKLDDEQKQKPLVQAPASVPLPPVAPEQEFRRRLAARGHGPLFDVDRCLECVRKQLGKLGVELAEFLEFDEAHTTGHGRSFSNPIGYYVGLAKDLVRARKDQTLKAMVAAASAGASKPPPDVPRNGHGRCITCNGAGVLHDGGFCGCGLGQDLARISRRKPKGESDGGDPRIRNRAG